MMRPSLKENSKYITNQKHSIQTKKKTASLEKHTYTNRSLFNNETSTPLIQKKNLTTQASDQKLQNQSQILRSLMKIQSKTNPTAMQLQCFNHPMTKAKYIVNSTAVCTNCSLEQSQKPTERSFNSVNQTTNPSPKLKTVSLSTYTSVNEGRERDIRAERITQLRTQLEESRKGLEGVRPELLSAQVDKIFETIITNMQQIRTEVSRAIDKCINAEQIQIRQTIESVRKMEEDIASNQFNIIEYMTMQPFNEIMSIYQQKFKEHQQFTHQILLQGKLINNMQSCSKQFDQNLTHTSRQLIQSLQMYLQLYVSFQNKDVFLPLPQVDNLFQTCETNNSIDEDQVIMKENHRVHDTCKFTDILKDYQCQRSLFPSESPQFKK